ncbi:MAG: hypothetical protein R3F43_03730 [bacterium]
MFSLLRRAPEELVWPALTLATGAPAVCAVGTWLARGIWLRGYQLGLEGRRQGGLLRSRPRVSPPAARPRPPRSVAVLPHHQPVDAAPADRRPRRRLRVQFQALRRASALGDPGADRSVLHQPGPRRPGHHHRRRPLPVPGRQPGGARVLGDPGRPHHDARAAAGQGPLRPWPPTALGLALVAASNALVELSAPLFYASLVITVLVAYALTGMGVGLGALAPRFDVDNPARIASGMGGVVFMLLGILYLVVITATLVWPVQIFRAGLLHGFWPGPGGLAAAGGLVALALALTALCHHLPLRLGARALDRDH